MALSDEDLAAIRVVRRFLDEAAPGDLGERAAWERVLALAGEKPSEPDDGTFWLDPEENDVWIRDDKAASFGFDLSRWFRTADDENFSWDRVLVESPKLVELVRADEAEKQRQEVLVELHGAWEAWHHNACGQAGSLARCGYHECVHRWTALRGFGYDEEWEEPG